MYISESTWSCWDFSELHHSVLYHGLTLANYFFSVGERRAEKEKEKSEDKQARVKTAICLGAWFDSLQLVLYSDNCFLQSSLRPHEFIFFPYSSISLPLHPSISLLLPHLGFSPIPSPCEFSQITGPFFIFLLKIRSSFHGWFLHSFAKTPPEYVL